jgi:hypothetical protein
VLPLDDRQPRSDRRDHGHGSTAIGSPDPIGSMNGACVSS